MMMMMMMMPVELLVKCTQYSILREQALIFVQSQHCKAKKNHTLLNSSCRARYSVVYIYAMRIFILIPFARVAGTCSGPVFTTTRPHTRAYLQAVSMVTMLLSILVSFCTRYKCISLFVYLCIYVSMYLCNCMALDCNNFENTNYSLV